MDENNIGGSKICSSPNEISEPTLTELGVNRTSTSRKNGNWTNEELSAALATYDNGMSMKKASEQFPIPYTSFREHCYGMRKSRTRGAKVVLSIDEKHQLSDWLISMVERGYGIWTNSQCFEDEGH